MNALSNYDWIIIGLYFGLCALIVLITIFMRKEDSLDGYFLSNRSLQWIFIGCSLFVSNMDQTNFINLAEYASTKGIAAIAFEWHSIWAVLLLCFFFAPIFKASEIYTVPGYIKRRFQSSWMGIYFAVINFLTSICIRLPIIIYSSGLFLKHVLDIKIYTSMSVLVPVTALYTVIGGFSSVIYTHTIQFLVIVVGGIMMAVYSLDDIGGLHILWNSFGNLTKQNLSTVTFDVGSWQYANQTNTTNTTTAMHLVIDDHWRHIFLPLDDEDYPWIGVVFSLPTTCIWFWCATQENVQKVISSKSNNHNRAAGVFTGFLRILPLFCMIFPGMAARIIFQDLDICLDRHECSYTTFSQLVAHILPRGVKGLLIVAIVASLMSTVSTILNSASNLFTKNIWKEVRLKASDRELLIVARICVMILTGLSFLWIYVCTNHYSLVLIYLQRLQSYLAASICPILLIGALSTKYTTAGASSGCIISLILTVVRFTFDIKYPIPLHDEIDKRPMFARLHYMYFSIIITAASIVCSCIISIFTQPIPMEMLQNLTWTTMDRSSKYGASNGKEMVEEIGIQNNIYESSFMDKTEVTEQVGQRTDQLFKTQPKAKSIIGLSVNIFLIILCVSLFITFSIV